MKKIVFIVCAFILAGSNFFIFAQNNNASEFVKPPAARDMEISYGMFVKALPGAIVLSEYDAEKDADAEVTYMVNAESKLTNVPDVDKISAGANIDIYYVSADGKKTAKNIVVELPDSVGAKTN